MWTMVFSLIFLNFIHYMGITFTVSLINIWRSDYLAMWTKVMKLNLDIMYVFVNRTYSFYAVRIEFQNTESVMWSLAFTL